MSDGKFPHSFSGWFWRRLNAVICTCAGCRNFKMPAKTRRMFEEIAADAALVEKLHELSPSWCDE